MGREKPASWLREAAKLLRTIQPRARTMEVDLRCPETGAHIQLRYKDEPDENGCSPNTDPLPAAPTPEPSTAAEKILAVLVKATEPLKARVIARLSGLSYTGSYFRMAMSQLVKDKRIHRDAKTYLYRLTRPV